MVKTEFVDYSKDDSGILKIVFKARFNQTLKIMDAHSYVSIVVQMSEGKVQPMLLNMLSFSNLPNVKLVKFLAKNEELQSVTGVKAVVLNSYIVRMIYTQYMKFVEVKRPYKIFKTEAEGLAWLKLQL